MQLVNSDKLKYKPSLQNIDHIPTMEDYEELEKSSKYPDAVSSLTLAEKTAVNIYTGPFYSISNSVLRGNSSKVEGFSSDEIAEIFVTSAMGCSGLAKASKSAPKYSYRIEDNFDPDLTQKRVDAVNNGGNITQEMGYFSTSAGLSSEDDVREMYTESLNAGLVSAIELTDLTGKYVASISQRPGECEYLIAPTQVQWVGHYQNEAGSHFFLAKPVQTPDGLTPRQLERTIKLPETDNPDTPSITAEVVAKTSESFKKRLQDVKESDSENPEDTTSLSI